MSFTIDSITYEFGDYRLQKSGSFRKLTRDHSLQKNDQSFENLNEAYEKLEQIRKNRSHVFRLIEPKKAKTYELSDFSQQLGIASHWETAAEIPKAFLKENNEENKRKLRLMIKGAPRHKPMDLVLGLDGSFKLQPHEEWSGSKQDYAAIYQEDPTIQKKEWGLSASDNTVKKLYRIMLAGWARHLQTGETGILLDPFVGDVGENRLLDKIARVTQKFQDRLSESLESGRKIA